MPYTQKTRQSLLLWCKGRIAVLTHIEPRARIGEPRPFLRVPAARARDDGLKYVRH